MNDRHRPANGVMRVDAGTAGGDGRHSVVHTVDDRWLLAYADAVGEESPEHVDPARRGGLTAHPVFCVAIEWPLMEGGPPGVEATAATLQRGVHLSHDIVLHAPLHPGRLRTDAALSTAVQRTGGTVIGLDFVTHDEQGRLLVTSRHVTFYRDVELDGEQISAPRARRAATDGLELSPVATTRVDSSHAMGYSGAARIWNPIHTDGRAAHDAGLPDTILHGTAVLSRPVSAVTSSSLVPPGARVAALGARFTGMVHPGTTLTTSAASIPASDGAVAFEVRTSDGTSVVSDGTVVFRRRTMQPADAMQTSSRDLSDPASAHLDGG